MKQRPGVRLDASWIAWWQQAECALIRSKVARQPKTWIVDFDSDAVVDFEDVKSRGGRKAVFNVVQKLKDLGPVAAKKKDFDRAVVEARIA